MSQGFTAQGEGFRVGFPEPAGLRSEGAVILTSYGILRAHLCGGGEGTAAG